MYVYINKIIAKCYKGDKNRSNDVEYKMQN